MHDAVNGQVLVGGEVADGVFAMADRGDQEVSEHGRETAGEDHGVVVAVRDVVWVVGIAGEQFADEAGSAEVCLRWRVRVRSSMQPSRFVVARPSLHQDGGDRGSTSRRKGWSW
nr:hypothetical protein [Kutzneria sp. CA-103260]